MSEQTSAPQVDAFSAQAQFFHHSVSRWLERKDVTIACGRWSDGAISEIIPDGQAKLLPAIYDGCFNGVREVRLEEQSHHLHVDFGRIHKLAYTVAPSVCLNFKPSFEMRLLTLGAGGAPTDRWLVSLMLETPYSEDQLNEDIALQFLVQAVQEARERPDLVEVRIDPEVQVGPIGPQLLNLLGKAVGHGEGVDWDTALAAISSPALPELAPFDPPLLPLLRKALALRDASLVIFRDRTLIEFKTERLDGIHRYEEAGHISWQIGDQHDHHCHLSLSVITKVLFSAEPVSCQGGGLNYTVWFLTSGPCGNPYRRDGYFSIVLNRPYSGRQPRTEVIEPVLELFRLFQHESWVEADETFIRVVHEGPPERPTRTELNDAPT